MEQYDPNTTQTRWTTGLLFKRSQQHNNYLTAKACHVLRGGADVTSWSQQLIEWLTAPNNGGE